MSSTAGAFESFYVSFLQHPLLLWLGALVGLVLIWLRPGLPGSNRAFCSVLVAISMLDAWLTANQVVGLGELTGIWSRMTPLAFVLIGDLRYFLFLEGAQSDGSVRLPSRAWIRALGWTLVVPLFSKVVHGLLPTSWATPRVLFLVYELAFLGLTLFITRRYVPSLSASTWTRRVSRFVALYYGLWAFSDLWILALQSDTGFLLRTLPNLLYYGGFAPVVAWSTERPARRRARRR